MKALLLFLLLTAAAGAQNIATRPLSASVPVRICLNPALTTTVMFPGPLSGAFGLGLVSGANMNGMVQLEHPEGSNILVLHALSDTAHVLATVVLDGALYVLDLQSGPAPDVAITLTKSGVGPTQTVTPEQVVAARPKYDQELLVGFLSKARNAPLLRTKHPELYSGYDNRNVQYISDSGSVKTVVTMVHRFSREDAIVLDGTVQNETTKPIQFDGRAATVLVASEIHPVKLLDCMRPIPAGAVVPVEVVIQGDIDGGRANLSINNEFRLILPEPDGLRTTWSLMNGRSGGKAKPLAPVPAIPLTQTGNPVREIK